MHPKRDAPLHNFTLLGGFFEGGFKYTRCISTNDLALIEKGLKIGGAGRARSQMFGVFNLYRARRRAVFFPILYLLVRACVRGNGVLLGREVTLYSILLSNATQRTHEDPEWVDGMGWGWGWGI